MAFVSKKDPLILMNLGVGLHCVSSVKPSQQCRIFYHSQVSNTADMVSVLSQPGSCNVCFLTTHKYCNEDWRLHSFQGLSLGCICLQANETRLHITVISEKVSFPRKLTINNGIILHLGTESL